MRLVDNYYDTWCEDEESSDVPPRQCGACGGNAACYRATIPIGAGTLWTKSRRTFHFKCSACQQRFTLRPLFTRIGNIVSSLVAFYFSYQIFFVDNARFKVVGSLLMATFGISMLGYAAYEVRTAFKNPLRAGTGPTKRLGASNQTAVPIPPQSSTQRHRQ